MAAAALVLVGVSAAAPGDLDPTFGEGGIVTTDFGIGHSAAGEALVVQSDGKLVLAGWCRCDEFAQGRFALARYNPSGRLDTSFDGDGIVTTAVGPNSSVATALALQEDGKLVAAGSAGGDEGEVDFALARYGADGGLDASFGKGGKVLTSIGFFDHANALVVQDDGKLVAAGSTGPITGRNVRFALVRYNPDGSLDTSFGGDGIVTTGLGRGVEGAHALALQDDGKLVAAGSSRQGRRFALVRYNPDGSLDTSFGGDGIVLTSLGSKSSRAHALLVQDDGKLVAAGGARGSTWSFALSRYTSDGSLDASFGGDGKVRTLIGAGSIAYALVLQQDGKLVAGGESGPGGPYPDFALARYNADGSLDSSFGGDGTVTTPISETYDIAESLAVQLDGRIVAAGWADISPSWDFALARYDG